jgi:hypothetical protein
MIYCRIVYIHIMLLGAKMKFNVYCAEAGTSLAAERSEADKPAT